MILLKIEKLMKMMFKINKTINSVMLILPQKTMLNMAMKISNKIVNITPMILVKHKLIIKQNPPLI